MRPVAAILLLCLALVGATISGGHSRSSSTHSIHLRGEVHRFEKFEGEIGRGLALRLVPDESGWNIEVGPKGTDVDLMSCVNGPFHGITPYQIEGWHFRNDDNTAPLKPAEFSTPGIGQKREFRFVVSASDQAKSCSDLNKILYIYDEKDPEHLAAMSRFGRYAGGDGWLTITSLTLGNLKPNERAWIEAMKFEAEVSFRGRSKDTAKTSHQPAAGSRPLPPNPRTCYVQCLSLFP